MKNRFLRPRGRSPLLALSALSFAVSATVRAQEPESEPASGSETIEEILVLGRIKSSAHDVVIERMDSAVSVDLIDSQMISRIGDSTVAEALTRIPSVTLVDGKFVYVRGLGERYSSTTLNGATVPSPDLTRSVIPLDIFPTSIVDNLAVQKVASADMPATFGGGNVDIRTRGMPYSGEFNIEIGTSMNTASRANVMDYAGSDDDRWGTDDGTRALSREIKSSLDLYQGDLSPSNIADVENISLDVAEAINRQLLLGLKRDVAVYRDSSPQQDFSVGAGGGYNWQLPFGMEFGFISGLEYDKTTRNKNSTTRILGIPDQGFTDTLRTVHNVNITGDASFGLRLDDQNIIQTTSIWIRDTDDDVSRADILNTNRQLSGGLGYRQYSSRYEIREMRINQIHGEHNLAAATLDTLNAEFLSFLEGLSFNWFYSDSESSTDIPSELLITSDTTVNPETGRVLSERVGRFSSAANYRFTELKDYVDSWGWNATMPISLDEFEIKLSGGAENADKTRVYQQTEFFIDTKDTPLAALSGNLNRVFGNSRVSAAENEMLIAVAGDNEDSYIAANKTLATFGKVDVTWNEQLRLVGGIRWEDFKQVSLPWNPLNYDGNQILPIPDDNPDSVAEYFDNATYAEDQTYLSTALTYMKQGFWAEDFQLRFSYGQTTVRPDLREISEGSYRDPITDILVFGNPDVTPAEIDNLDLRAEWFFGNGDNFTATLFAKDLENPIEFFETAASDDNIAAEVVNAEQGKITGLELEFLTSLDNFHSSLSPFFVQGNMTLLDTEITAGADADAPTNTTRPMAGASDFSGNLIFGFDSPDELHSTTLALNYFSERLYFAGRNGREDTYEQPFASLDATYSFYPSEMFVVKFKAQNILNDNIEITQEASLASGSTFTSRDVTILEQKRGQTISLGLEFKM